MKTNTEKDFPKKLQYFPQPSYFIEDFFSYRFEEEYINLKKRGGIYKILAFLKLVFF